MPAEAARNKAITVNLALEVKLATHKSTGRAKVVKRQFKPALAPANLPTTGRRMQDLRHRYVSILDGAGAPSFRIAQHAGHASDSITRTTQMHLFQTGTSAHMDKLDRPASSEEASQVVELRQTSSD